MNTSPPVNAGIRALVRRQDALADLGGRTVAGDGAPKARRERLERLSDSISTPGTLSSEYDR